MALLTHPSGSNVPTSHHNTPKSELKDALGRTIRTTDHKAASDNGTTPVYLDVVMKYQYDIRGNLKVVTDALDRIAFEYEYDFANQPLKTTHIDSGTSKAVIDASGKPIEGNDAKHAQSLASYDRFARPVHAWVKNGSGDSLRMVGFNKYGEEATDPADNNLLGQLWEQYDEAGKQIFKSYDFKGNLLSKSRYVFSATTLTNQLDGYDSFLVDWTSLPSITEASAYETDNLFDALNRITKITLPSNVDSARKEIIPSYNRAGALEKVVYSNSVFVSHIAYNAKGQRLFIAFRNNVFTRYTYDPITFRLLRQRTEKFTKTTDGNTITYDFQSGTNRQDDAFELDLVGNILKILHRVTDCGITGSTLGSDALNRNFEYDPLNRLLSATGRESDTNNQNDYLYADAPAPGSPNANNVNAYEQKYQYDKMGNVLQVKQLGANAFTRNFTYNTDVNTLQKIETGGAALIENYTYDLCGNQVTAGTTRHYQWTAANRLLIYKNQTGSSDPTIYAQYDYDAAGNRVSKLVRTGTAGSPIYYRTIYIDGIYEYHRLENGTTYKKSYAHVADGSSKILSIRVGDVFPDDISDATVFNLEDHLGGTTIRLNSSGNVIDSEEYYPFGDSSLRTFSKKQYRYVGKEKDAESGLYYYGARYYSAWTCRFISVDPLTNEYAHLTPYVYAGNKPINAVDIDGLKGENESQSSSSNIAGAQTLFATHSNQNIGDLIKIIPKVHNSESHSFVDKGMLLSGGETDYGLPSDNPIYDKKTSEFLGTDERGLEGEAIIMDKADFTQGMSHSEAMSKGSTMDSMSMSDALNFANNGNFENFLTHYNNLSQRPDFDGFVSINEGVDWALRHPGALNNPTANNMLYINAANLDFGNLSVSAFQNINEVTPVNLLNAKNLAMSSYNETLRGTVYALGRVNMVLTNRESRTVSIVNDYNLPANRATDYDWNTGGGNMRNSLINAERKRTGINDTHGFRVFYYGLGTLNR